MRYLLDTDVVSNLEKLHPNANLIGWLHDIDPSDLALPLSVIFEIQHGIELAKQSNPERAVQKEAWLCRLLQAKDLCILHPTVADARLRARMAATPTLRHFLLQSPNARKIKTGEDIVIAATAIVHQAVVVTFNETDFKTIHEQFPLPGIFHPGRLAWVVEPSPYCHKGHAHAATSLCRDGASTRDALVQQMHQGTQRRSKGAIATFPPAKVSPQPNDSLASSSAAHVAVSRRARASRGTAGSLQQ